MLSFQELADVTPLLVKGIKTDCHRPCSCKQCLILPCGSTAEYEKVLCQDETCSFGWAIGLSVWIEMVLRSILYVFLIWVYSRSRTGCVEYPGLHQGNHR